MSAFWPTPSILRFSASPQLNNWVYNEPLEIYPPCGNELAERYLKLLGDVLAADIPVSW